jgi:hypothetical protein
MQAAYGSEGMNDHFIICFPGSKSGRRPFRDQPIPFHTPTARIITDNDELACEGMVTKEYLVLR